MAETWPRQMNIQLTLNSKLFQHTPSGGSLGSALFIMRFLNLVNSKTKSTEASSCVFVCVCVGKGGGGW